MVTLTGKKYVVVKIGTTKKNFKRVIPLYATNYKRNAFEFRERYYKTHKGIRLVIINKSGIVFTPKRYM